MNHPPTVVAPGIPDQRLTEDELGSTAQTRVRDRHRRCSGSAILPVADAGRLMPPKSTWFEPKLADGLLSHVLD
jgi:hypothetical protein